MKSLESLRSRYHRIARRLAAPAIHVRFSVAPRHDGGPHVEREGDRYAWVVTERGSELERRTTADPEDLLYWMVSDLTRAMASDFEVAHREVGRDFRRLLFGKHLELLASVGPAWAERKRAEYERVLAEHPFVDGGP